MKNKKTLGTADWKISGQWTHERITNVTKNDWGPRKIIMEIHFHLLSLKKLQECFFNHLYLPRLTRQDISIPYYQERKFIMFLGGILTNVTGSFFPSKTFENLSWGKKNSVFKSSSRRFAHCSFMDTKGGKRRIFISR